MTATTIEVCGARVSRHFVERIPYEFARRHLILSQGRSSGQVSETLTCAPTTNPDAVRNTVTRLRRPCHVVTANADSLARLIDDVYEDAIDPAPTDSGEADDLADRAAPSNASDLLSIEGKAPVVRLINAILLEAMTQRCSDVHLQPRDDHLVVRMRCDGVLRTTRTIDHHLSRPMLSRLKVMAGMDIAEQRLPQDGRASVRIGDPPGRAADLRVSTVPTRHGERAVIRILDPSKHPDDLAALGMPADTHSRYTEHTAATQGLVLLSGPTGSGKTTTMYATLRDLASRADSTHMDDDPSISILTLEDPIEYDLSAVSPAVSQSQVSTTRGITFASGLRHMLRQDPDVIMVGEIRDTETARIAIQASLTGHLVLSTVHTTDAPSAALRLVDLGVEPFLVAASLRLVLAQRLVRRLHAPCGGRGCRDCGRSGTLGRIGLFELLIVTRQIRNALAAPRSGEAWHAAIRAIAEREGMRSLATEAAELVARHEASETEIRRVLGAAEEADR